jgi:hypothetical protein
MQIRHGVGLYWRSHRHRRGGLYWCLHVLLPPDDADDDSYCCAPFFSFFPSFYFLLLRRLLLDTVELPRGFISARDLALRLTWAVLTTRRRQISPGVVCCCSIRQRGWLGMQPSCFPACKARNIHPSSSAAESAERQMSNHRSKQIYRKRGAGSYGRGTGVSPRSVHIG